MRTLLIAILLFSVNSWAGPQVQHCSNNSVAKPIQLCFEWNRLIGKLNVDGEKIDLQFSDETQPKASFILSSNGQSGAIEIFESEALFQINNNAPIQLTCDQIKPGSCHW